MSGRQNKKNKDQPMASDLINPPSTSSTYASNRDKPVIDLDSVPKSKTVFGRLKQFYTSKPKPPAKRLPGRYGGTSKQFTDTAVWNEQPYLNANTSYNGMPLVKPDGNKSWPIDKAPEHPSNLPGTSLVTQLLGSEFDIGSQTLQVKNDARVNEEFTNVVSNIKKREAIATNIQKKYYDSEATKRSNEERELGNHVPEQNVVQVNDSFPPIELAIESSRIQHVSVKDNKSLETKSLKQPDECIEVSKDVVPSKDNSQIIMNNNLHRVVNSSNKFHKAPSSKVSLQDVSFNRCTSGNVPPDTENFSPNLNEWVVEVNNNGREVKQVSINDELLNTSHNSSKNSDQCIVVKQDSCPNQPPTSSNETQQMKELGALRDEGMLHAEMLMKSSAKEKLEGADQSIVVKQVGCLSQPSPSSNEAQQVKEHDGLVAEHMFLTENLKNTGAKEKLEEVDQSIVVKQVGCLSQPPPTTNNAQLVKEHDAFVAKGMFLAKKLRKLPEEKRAEAEKSIAHIFFQIEQDKHLGEHKIENYTSSGLGRQPIQRMIAKGNANKSPHQNPPSLRQTREYNGKELYPNSELQGLNGNNYEEECDNEDEHGYIGNVEHDGNDSQQRIPLAEQKRVPKSKEISNGPILRSGFKYIPEVPILPKEAKPPKKTIPSNSSKETTFSKPSSSFPLLYVCITLFLVTTAIFLFLYRSEIMKNFTKSGLPQPDIDTVMNNLKQDFNNQPLMTFKIVKSAIRKVMEPYPKEPAIILLLTAQGAESVGSRFARKLAGSVSPEHDPICIPGDKFLTEDTDVAKKYIDDTIKENLQEDNLRVVLIERLNDIPGETAMILHTYCDHENAPFKRVVYIMTVVSEKTQLGDDPKGWDIMAQDHLYNSWDTTGKDQISSLLSRLTVSVAAILPVGG